MEETTWGRRNISEVDGMNASMHGFQASDFNRRTNYYMGWVQNHENYRKFKEFSKGNCFAIRKTNFRL